MCISSEKIYDNVDNDDNSMEEREIATTYKIQSISYFNIKVNNMIRPYSAFIVIYVFVCV